MVDETWEPATWGDPVPEEELRGAEAQLGHRLPTEWREYLQRPRWLRKAWLTSGSFVWLYDPTSALDVLDAWGKSTARHPGIYVLGGDGGSAMFCVDLRSSPHKIVIVDNVSPGWHDAEPLDLTVAQFVHALDAGSFDLLAALDEAAE